MSWIVSSVCVVVIALFGCQVLAGVTEKLSSPKTANEANEALDTANVPGRYTV
jgi:hypothetical protein